LKDDSNGGNAKPSETVVRGESGQTSFEREKWQDELQLRKSELELKKRELSRSLWANPLSLAIFAATVAALGNAAVALLNGTQERALQRERAVEQVELEQRKADLQADLERKKAEAARILEVIKTGDPDKTKINLQFLLQAGLVRDEATAKDLRSFLESAPAKDIPSLPASDVGQSSLRPDLYVLAIGIDSYQRRSTQPNLAFANKDATDLATLFQNSGSLYRRSRLTVLTNENATRANIFAELARPDKPTQGDVAIFFYSGESALIDDQYYLLPYDVDDRSEPRIKASSLPISELQAEFARRGSGSLLVLLDTCPKGGVGEGLHQALSASGISLISASSGSQLCLEDPRWTNGAFTKVLLSALSGAADLDKNGLVSVTELAAYTQRELSALTGGRQSPSVSLRFVRDLVAAR
jgi:hypothetical protein